MHRRAWLLASASMLLTLSACGAGTAPARHAELRATPDAFLPPARSRSDIVELSEIESLPVAANALEVVRQLRPAYLFPRSVSTQGGRLEPTVYLDNIRLGSIQLLSTIPREAIEDIRYLQPFAAQLWMPPGQNGPAIVVRSKRR
jgi:hypothetical protein